LNHLHTIITIIIIVISMSPDPKQLATLYKKKGAFDKQRKRLLADFRASETHANLLLKIKMIVESRVRADPSILRRNRGKVGALIQGDITQQRGENPILSIVDRDIQEKIIDSPEFHRELRSELGEVKRVLLGLSEEEWAERTRQERERATAARPDSPPAFGGYKLKPKLKAPRINISQLKY
jgi:COMPASS component SHG1